MCRFFRKKGFIELLALFIVGVVRMENFGVSFALGMVEMADFEVVVEI